MPEDFFSKHGLEVKAGEVEEGKSYPIYGMITDILEGDEREAFVELNYNIKLKVTMDGTENKMELIKSRSLEAGIFLVKIVKKHDASTTLKHFIEADCTTMVFGKKKEFQA